MSTYIHVRRSPAGEVSNGDGERVGTFRVLRDAGEKFTRPLRVIDETGAELGPLDQHTPNPRIFNPNDGKTVWLGEDTFVAQHDVATQKIIRRIDAPNGSVFVGLATLASGHVITIERAKRSHKAQDREADKLVLFDARGTRVKERTARPLEVAPLGNRFVTSEDGARRFIVYDTSLEIVDEVPFAEPASEGGLQLRPDASGRGWIAISPTGEWDHYGEAPAAAKKPAAPTAAKSPAAKPAGKVPAAKKTPVASSAPAKKTAAKKKR